MRKLFTPVLEINQQPDNILDFGEIRVDMNVCVKWANYIVSHRSQAPILKWYRGRLCDIRKYGIIVQRVGNISYCDETSPARSVWLCLYLQGSYPPPLFSYCSAGLLSLIPRSSITVVLRLQFLHSIPLKIFMKSNKFFWSYHWIHFSDVTLHCMDIQRCAVFSNSVSDIHHIVFESTRPEIFQDNSF